MEALPSIHAPHWRGGGRTSRAQDVELVQAAFVKPKDVVHGHMLAAQALPLPMDKEIAEDIALLQAQQKIVDDAEAKLASAYGSKPLAPRGAARMQAAQFQGVPEGRAPTGQLMMPPSDADPTGDPRPAAKPWEEGASPERGYEVAHFAVRNGPADLAEVDGDKVADWNDFFNNMNARVPCPALPRPNPPPPNTAPAPPPPRPRPAPATPLSAPRPAGRGEFAAM